MIIQWAVTISTVLYLHSTLVEIWGWFGLHQFFHAVLLCFLVVDCNHGELKSRAFSKFRVHANIAVQLDAYASARV